MGRTSLLVKLDGEHKICEWIYRILAHPAVPWGGLLPPSPVVAPGSALRARPRVALASAQDPPVYSRPRRRGQSALRRPSQLVLTGSPPGVGRREVQIPLGPELRRATSPLVCGRDGTDHARQPDRVVVLDVRDDPPARLFHAQGSLNAKAFSFQSLVPALKLAVALRRGRRGPHGRPPAGAEEPREFPREEARALVREEPRSRVGEGLPGPWEERRDGPLGPALAECPGDEEPTAAVADAAEGEIGSSLSSERTSFVRGSVCSRRATLQSWRSRARRVRGWRATAAFWKNSFCPRENRVGCRPTPLKVVEQSRNVL